MWLFKNPEVIWEFRANTGFNRISANTHRYQIVKLDASRFAQGWIDHLAVKFRVVGYTYGSDPSYFTAPPQITFTAGAWTTVDVSSQVDADADGVVLFIQNEDSFNRTYGMRELTSSDITLSMRNERSRMQLVGLDAAKKFDAYIQTTGVKVYLVGQTKGSVVYYTNNVAVTDPILNSWQPLDADDYAVAAEANGLVLSVSISGSVTNIGFRHGDSTDDFPGRKLNGNQSFQAAVGLNALNEWGEYMGNTGLDVSIAAYTKGSGGGGNWMATSTYTGDGTAGNAITGVGFQPDAVIVKMYPNRKAQMRTSTMTGDATKELQSTLALGTGKIQSLDTDGFTLGSNVSVNESGNPFYWIAFKDTAGVCKVGTYTGDGVNNRSITGVGFQPDYVIVASAGAHNSVHRSSSMTGDTTLRFDATGVQTNMIKALEADGFQLGTDGNVNGSGTVYHYVAFKAATGKVAVGTYAGDGVDNRNITVGFQPKWVIVDTSALVTYDSPTDDSPGSVHRPASMSGDVSINFSWAWTTTTWANCIQAIQSNGFQVGNDAVVNQSATTYYWIAFKTGTAGAAPKPKILKWVEVDPYGP